MYWVNVLLELVKRKPHCAKFGLIYANGVDGSGILMAGKTDLFCERDEENTRVVTLWTSRKGGNRRQK